MNTPPIILRFVVPLTQDAFDKFVTTAFEPGSPYKLWGYPMIIGPMKLHVYGCERDNWNPLYIELTDQFMVIVTPQEHSLSVAIRLVRAVRDNLTTLFVGTLGDKPLHI